MSDEEIKKLLAEYVNAEMSLIDIGKYNTYEVEPSRKFNKRMKTLLSIEKCFGPNIKLGYFIRRVAILLVCILSLMGVNEVSAKVFGFDAWKYIVSFVSENKMERKVYQEKNTQSEEINGRVKLALYNYPQYIPGDLKLTVKNTEPFGDCYFWENVEQKQAVVFDRVKISEGLVVMTDAEYTTKEECEVGGYLAYYYSKNDEHWISWDDYEYNCTIDIVGFPNAKEELIKIANSMYE